MIFFEEILIGCLTGFFSAFFGIGGSSIDTPLLRTLLDFPPHLALGTPLPTALLTIIVALLTYWKRHLVNFRVFKFSVLGGLPGIILGSFFSGFFSGKILMISTAVVLFFVGANFLSTSLRKNKQREKRKDKSKSASPAFLAGIGATAGLVSGILANSGGLFLIPAFVILLQMRIKEAIATSLLVVSVMILPACLIHFNLGHVDLRASLAMGIGVLPMAWLGARMDLRTRDGIIQMLFGTILLVFSVYFLILQIKA